jgi:hypothetical protein
MSYISSLEQENKKLTEELAEVKFRNAKLLNDLATLVDDALNIAVISKDDSTIDTSTFKQHIDGDYEETHD